MKENLVKKSRMKKEGAITLIALVVSIVVILLLAGVTIATLTGDNGILSQAQNAQEKNQIAKFKDDVSMAYMEKYAEKAQEGDFTPITATGNNENIGPNTSITKYYDTYTVAKDGIYSFQVKNNANNQTSTTVIKVEGIEKFTPIENAKVNGQSVSYYNSENKAYNYNGAAVPKGYYVDTKSTVENGLVITDEIDSEGYSTGNEWVWVPVNSTVGNEIYYSTETSEKAIAGATSVKYTKYSKLYSFTGMSREAYGTFHDYGTNTATLSRPSTTSSPGYREIAILDNTTYGETGKYNLINNRTTGTAFSNVIGVATQYRDDYDNMVASVNKYHGFYIGRYELANINGTAKEQPGDPYTNENWYSLYNKCLTLNKGTNTETSMVYGALWDATMQWLAKSGISVGYTGNTTSGYGNYCYENVTVSNNKKTNNTTIKVKASGTSAKLQTGQTSYTVRKNIYDLSGNCYDWTQEAYNTNYRVLRGGRWYDYDANETYSSNRIYHDLAKPTLSYDSRSSRSQLYIKRD